MTRRIVDTTKDSDEQQQDLKKLKEILLKSNYPNKEVEKIIQETLREHSDNSAPNPKSQKEDQTKYTLTLPYYPDIEVLKHRLEIFKIKLYFSYGKKLSSLLPSNKKMESKSVIYKIQCSCGDNYVGETKVGFPNRMKQHESLIERDSEDTHSEIIQHHHAKKWQCLFDPTKAIILDNETSYRRRKVKETIYSNIVNSINKHDKLDDTWQIIISKNGDQIRKRIKFKEDKTRT